MKKTFITVLLALGISFVNAQEKISFSKIIQTDSVTAEGIFVSIKEWMSMEFKKGNNAIEIEDKEAGLIIANAVSGYKSTKRGISYMWADGSIEYKLNIQIKDNRFKVTVTNFIHKGATGTDHLGVLTTMEDSNAKWGKKQYNEVWKDLKIKSEKIASEWFDRLSKINFNDFKKDTSDDW